MSVFPKRRLSISNPTSIPASTSPSFRIIFSSTTYAVYWPLDSRKNFAESDIVECVCGAAAVMAGTEYGHAVRILLYPLECDMS